MARRIRWILETLLLGLFLLSPADANCQTTKRTVQLASRDFRYAATRMKVTSMRVQRQYSKSSCTFGYSYGFDTNAEIVWVNRGCRAQFVVTTRVCCSPTIRVVRLESSGYRYAQRSMRVSSMKVKNQLSRSSCRKYYSFGFDGERVWVDNGCRADFEVVTVVCA